MPKKSLLQSGQNNMNRYETILKIAKEHLRIETLETRKRDSLDFHDVAVWGIKDALEAAYEAGYEAGKLFDFTRSTVEKSQ
jgi:hypothetical protein